MGTRETFSTQRFVVRHASDGKDQPPLPALDDLGEVQPLASSRGGWLVTLLTPASSPRTGWQTLQARLGAHFLVVPAIDAGEGALRYPTGLVSVRFAAPVTDADMRRFARAHELEVVKRASFTKVQALFRPVATAATFLPDMSSALSASADADAVWLDAESAYSRSA